MGKQTDDLHDGAEREGAMTIEEEMEPMSPKRRLRRLTLGISQGDLNVINQTVGAYQLLHGAENDSKSNSEVAGYAIARICEEWLEEISLKIRESYDSATDHDLP